MKQLVLIRHAKSSWSDPLLDDFDRPLNKRSLKDAPFMAKLLRKKGLKPDLIVSSASLRTKLTLEFFIKEFDYKGKLIFERSIYEAAYKNLLKIIKNVEKRYKTLFLVAHNPSLNDLADFLLGNFEENIPTCGIVQIDFDVENWSDISKNNATLICFEYPKKY